MPETGVGQNRVSFYVEDVWDTETPAKPTVIVQPVNIYNRLGDTLTVDRSFQVPLERTTRQETVNGGVATRQVWQATVRFVAPTLLANLIVINPDGLFRSYPILFNPTQGTTLSDMFQKGRELMKAEATSGEIRRHVDQVLQEITDLKRSMEYLADTGIKDGAVTVPKLAVETKTYIQTQVNNRVDQIVGGNVTGSLDTLKEIADAITGNQNVITNLIAQIGDRYTKTESDSRFAAASHTHSSSQITDATQEAKANMIVKRDANKNFGAGTIWLENQPTDAPQATRKDYVDSLGPVATKVNAATAAAEPNKLALRDGSGNFYLGDESKLGEAALDLRSQKLAFRIYANDNTIREDFGIYRDKDSTTANRGRGSILTYKNKTNEWDFYGIKITNIAEPANDTDAVNWGKVKNAVKWTSESTSSATRSTLIWRDSNGRAQVRDPQDNWDIANKQYVQPTIDKVNAATAYDVPNTLVQRSETGFIGVAGISITSAPTQGTHGANKQYVDDEINKLSSTKTDVANAAVEPTPNTLVKRDSQGSTKLYGLEVKGASIKATSDSDPSITFVSPNLTSEIQQTRDSRDLRLCIYNQTDRRRWADFIPSKKNSSGAITEPLHTIFHTRTVIEGATELKSQLTVEGLSTFKGDITTGNGTTDPEHIFHGKAGTFKIFVNGTGGGCLGIWDDTQRLTKFRIYKNGNFELFGGHVNVGNNKIYNLADPTSDTDAVNKRWVNNSAGDIHSTRSTLVRRDNNGTISAGNGVGYPNATDNRDAYVMLKTGKNWAGLKLNDSSGYFELLDAKASASWIRFNIGGGVQVRSSVDFGSHTVSGIKTPTESSHAVNKAYVDNATTFIGKGATASSFVKTDNQGYITAAPYLKAGTNTPDYTIWNTYALVPRWYVDNRLDRKYTDYSGNTMEMTRDDQTVQITLKNVFSTTKLPRLERRFWPQKQVEFAIHSVDKPARSALVTIQTDGYITHLERCVDNVGHWGTATYVPLNTYAI